MRNAKGKENNESRENITIMYICSVVSADCLHRKLAVIDLSSRHLIRDIRDNMKAQAKESPTSEQICKEKKKIRAEQAFCSKQAIQCADFSVAALPPSLGGGQAESHFLPRLKLLFNRRKLLLESVNVQLMLVERVLRLVGVLLRCRSGIITTRRRGHNVLAVAPHLLLLLFKLLEEQAFPPLCRL